MSLFAFYFLMFSAIYIILAWGIYLPFRGNQLYYGAIYSMMIGGYFAAYAARDWDWPFWLAIIGGVGLSMLFSLVFAFKLAGLGVFPMLIATIALVLIVQTVIRNLDFLGGYSGMFCIPRVPREILLPLVYGLVLIIGLFIYRLDHSHIGRALDAIHFDRGVAATLGIDANKLSVQLQVIASAMGALAGGLYVFTLGSLSPDAFGFFMLLYAVTILVVGGVYTMWGTVVASPILWGLSQFIPETLQQYSVIIYGLLLILILILRPAGVIDRKAVRMIVTRSKALLRRSSSFHN